MTQRGNHRQRVFFGAGDEEAYLRLLREHAAEFGVRLVAYCLMPNHVHLVAIPDSPPGLHRLMKAVHGQYAQRVNRMREITGHLWQGRYFSSVLDSNYFLNAVRYVELNPVRAGIVARAEDHAWSSAAAHCGRRSDSVVAEMPDNSPFAGIANWSQWLAEGVAPHVLDSLRDCGWRNLPCGSSRFIKDLEKASGRTLARRKPGRQPQLRQESLEFGCSPGIR